LMSEAEVSGPSERAILSGPFHFTWR
jgi:hypothetical protein